MRFTMRANFLARAKFALPSLVTLLSVACGFSSIAMSVGFAGMDARANFQAAAYFSCCFSFATSVRRWR